MKIRNGRELGGFLRQAREDAGFTQAELAKSLGVRRQRIIYMERGEGQFPLTFVFSALQGLGVTLRLEVNDNPAAARKPSKNKSVTPPGYSIDDIADGKSDRSK
jgi:transcriptional regulator with XRE-family HTH domain